MERNKLLYGLGDAALVVASSADSGGTWTGATEALQHGRVKVFVKSTGVLAPGNSKLVRLGGIPFPPGPWGNLRDMFTAPEERNRGLFSETTPAQMEVSGKELCKSEEGLTMRDAYPLVVDAMVALLREPQADELLAAKMCVRTAQVKDWLKRGVRESRIRKVKKPVRYVANTPTLFTE